MRAINASIMRQVNQKMILNRIRIRPISRAELADETGLTRASVTQIVEELIGAGMVIETAVVGRTRLGRRSTQLAINPGAGAIFAVNLGRGQCTVGVTDMRGATLAQSTELVPGRTPGEILDAVAAIIDRQMQELSLDREKIFGVGVCAPGPLNAESGVLLNPARFEMWHNLPLAQLLSQRTGLEVWVESAADAQALEQKYFGRAGESFALVRLDETLSVGVVVRDGLYRGASGFSAELGQCPVNVEGLRNLGELISAGGRADWRRLAEPEDGALMRLAYPLAGVLCAYQVRRAVLGGEASEKMQPQLPALSECLRQLLPEPLCREFELSVAETNPVRMAVSVAYERIFA